VSTFKSEKRRKRVPEKEGGPRERGKNSQQGFRSHPSPLRYRKQEWQKRIAGEKI